MSLAALGIDAPSALRNDGMTRRGLTSGDQTPATGPTSGGVPHLPLIPCLMAYIIDAPMLTPCPLQKLKPNLSVSRSPCKKRKIRK